VPDVLVLAGPNGAGKSTAAPHLVREVLGLDTFVNADTIAAGLAGFATDAAAIAAGRVMLQQMNALSRANHSFAFETTLASRSFAPRLRAMRDRGYRVSLAFLWLPSADLAVQRVARRVEQGGHDIPDDVIRRRYARGLKNLVTLYLPLAARWAIYNADAEPPTTLARRAGDDDLEVIDETAWKSIQLAATDRPGR
jgi:predicted ABC-type ATPase